VSAFRAGHELDVVRGRLVVLLLLDVPAEQDVVELAGAEAGQVEVDLQPLEVEQLEPQELLVPAGVKRQLVVGDLCCAQHKSPYVVFAVMWRSPSKRLFWNGRGQGKTT
jgi:hypothetical protein